MKKLLLVTTIISASMAANAQTKFDPPKTKAIPVVDTLHNVVLTDNYRWLEDKKDEKVIEWTQKQHDYGVEYLAKTQKVHAGLQEQIAAYINMDYEGPLNNVGKRVFQTVKLKGDKQSKTYTILNGKKILIWDPVQLDSTGKTSTTGINYTYDGERAAVNAQKSGAEVNTVYFIDTRTGKQLLPPLHNIFGFQWTRDQQHAYITLRSQEDVDKQNPLKTYLLKVGDPVEKAVFIGTVADAKNSYYIYDNRYSDVTFSGESDFYSNTLKIRPTGSAKEGKQIYSSKKFAAYPDAIGDKLYIMTNDNAPNYKLMIADKAQPDYKYWKTLIPEGKTVMENCVVTKNSIIVQDKLDLVSRLTIYDLNGKKLRAMPLPEKGSIGSVSYDRELDSVYISLVTFTSTPKTYVASPKEYKWRLFYQRHLPVDMSNIVGEIKFYNSKDGTRVPVFVVHRKDIKLDGNNPVLLTAYGGFQSGIKPGYMGFYAPFINAGGILVEPGIRGGDEFGEQWHLDGMLAKKQNCFDDFYACAEWLVKEKYTNTTRIVAMGGSNGGLLMGAAATQRPDLFKAIVCQVPLLDMLRYHKFLIARYWIPEYGAAEDTEQFQWLLRYSPYHNIRAGVNIPPMLVTSGANDTRVDPMNAKKFVAAVQNNPGQVSPVILHMDFDSGHGSGQSTEQSIKNWTFTFEYVMNQLGM
ncbi:S9 family peptidase [Mucilaginibacter terrenus]|uniref:prolyl oligopeptidase n=1 Tax=Mucilaginibacter terrenus TaxID=2482727 RepID=A0A3E2NQA2_9SPHI|nr:prolyl oligopeptidase family serine peptidase [Mucilaginibacter terrenus]RFZ83176.1 S9 family peptidase [Mucilaginibacter terrenus]